MDISTMSKDELERVQVAKETEYQLAMDSLATVEIEDAKLAREIAEKQLSRKNLATALIQGKHNLRRIASELRNIKTMIYRRLGGL